MAVLNSGKRRNLFSFLHKKPKKFKIDTCPLCGSHPVAVHDWSCWTCRCVNWGCDYNEEVIAPAYDEEQSVYELWNKMVKKYRHLHRKDKK